MHVGHIYHFFSLRYSTFVHSAKMIKTTSLVLLFFGTCLADIPVTPPVRCGVIPKDIYSCMGNPKVMEPSVSTKCSYTDTQCDRMTCLFKESGWMSGDQVDKAKLVSHFDQFKKDYPEWTAAVDSLKSSCVNVNLPAQGVHVNCPAYDVMLCALTSFIKNVPPGQWSTAASCEYARQYAAACPVCPNDCFAPLVPTGSCNSCLLLPRYS